METKIFEPYVFHSPATQKKGVRVTVVGEIVNGVLNFAVARCGEEDRFLFNKKEGRKIALKRLSEGKVFTSIVCESPNLGKFISAAKVISDVVIKHSTYETINLEEKVVTTYSYKTV